MDAGRASNSSRNGARIREDAVVEKEGGILGDLGPGLAQRCPYGLGANCPLVEAVKNGDSGLTPYRCPYGLGKACPLPDIVSKCLEEQRPRQQLAPALIGIIVAIVAVGMVHF